MSLRSLLFRSLARVGFGLTPLVLPAAALGQEPAKENVAPTVEPLTIVVAEDGTTSGHVSASDADGDALTFHVTRAAKAGELHLDEKTGAFRYVPRADFHGQDGFRVDVRDGKARARVDAKVTVTAVNDAPKLAGATVGTKEDAPVNGRVRGTDVDGDALVYSVDAPPKQGAVTVAEKTGAFTYTPSLDANGEDAFRVVVSDGNSRATADVKVTIAPVNDRPVLAEAALDGAEDGELQGQLRATDVDGDAVRFALKGPARHGQVTVDEVSGKVTYKPRANFHGEDSFAIVASDGRSSASGVVKVAVTPVNDPPVAEGASAATQEDAPVEVRLKAIDVDGDALTWSVTKRAATGEATVTDPKGRLRYVPRADSHGEDELSVTVSDGKSTSTAVVKIKIAAVNDPPVAKEGSVIVPEDGSVSGTLSASDIDGDTITYRIVRDPRHGAVTLKDPATGAFVYTPRGDFHGADAFTFEASDGKARAQALVKIAVSPVNDAPVAKGLSLETLEDKPVTVKVSASDVDGDALSYRVATPPKNGGASVDEKTGALTYTPRPGYFGDDAFALEVKDGEAQVEVSATVKVAPINDPPVLAPLALSGDEDAPARGTLSATDPEGDEVGFRLRTRARHGEVALDEKSGAITYTPGKHWHGEDAFVVEASDGKLSSTGEVKVRVAPQNDAPVVGRGAYRTREDTAVDIKVSANDVDGDKLTFRVTRPPSKGAIKVTDAAAGRFSYTPHADAFGDDVFTVAADDGKAAPTAEVTVAVAAVNDAPVARGLVLSLAEDSTVDGVLAATDVDEDALVYRVVRAPRHGTVTVHDPKSGAFTYTPRRDFAGEDAFVFEASDGTLAATAEVKLSVAARNDAPVVQALTLNTAEDTPARGRIHATDVDGDVLGYRVGAGPRLGSLDLDAATGALTYKPHPDANGADKATVEVTDGTDTVTVEVTLEVLRVPDPPRVRDEVLDTREDETVTVTLPAEDADGDKLTFRLLSEAKRGTATLLAGKAGALRYTPSPNVNGDDDVHFEVSDGRHTVKAVARIRIAPVNDAPTVEPVTVSTEEDSAVSGTLTGADIDGDALTFRVHEQPAAGKVTIAKDNPRRFHFVPALNQEGVATFQVVAFDGSASSAPATVTVHIAGSNDAPVAKGLRFTTDEDKPYRGVLEASDGDGDALTFRITRQPSRGAVTLDDATKGAFLYTPKRDVFGTDSFSFSATDGDGTTATGLVRVKVVEVDDPPVAMREYTDAPAYGRVTRKLQGFDPEGSSVTYRIVKQPRFGRVELRDDDTGEYVFISNGNAKGSVQFEFVVNDGTFDSLPAPIEVNLR